MGKLRDFWRLRRHDVIFWVVALVTLPASILIPLWFSQLQHRGPRDLAAKTAVVRIKASGPEERTGRAEFRLINYSNKTIHIEQIAPSCNCVEVTRGQQSAIAAGGVCDLVFRANFPEAGTNAAQIQVFHDGPSQRLTLRVEMTGSGAFPGILRIRNASQTFPSLSSTAEESEITIEARESIDSKNFISGLDCDIDCVKLTLDRTSDTPSGSSYVDRTYVYRLGWKRLPKASPFRGRIWLSQRDPKNLRIEIGEMSGTLGSQNPISPSVIRIDPSKDTEERILFGPNTGNWRFAPERTVPRWLRASWEKVEQSAALVISLEQHDEHSESDRIITISFVNDRGETAKLVILSEDPMSSTAP